MNNQNNQRDDKFNKKPQGGQQPQQRPEDRESQGQKKDAQQVPSSQQNDQSRK